MERRKGDRAHFPPPNESDFIEFSNITIKIMDVNEVGVPCYVFVLTSVDSPNRSFFASSPSLLRIFLHAFFLWRIR